MKPSKPGAEKTKADPQRDVCGSGRSLLARGLRVKDQMGRTTIFRVNLQKEGGSGVRMSGPPPKNATLAFVVLEDEGSRLSYT